MPLPLDCLTVMSVSCPSRWITNRMIGVPRRLLLRVPVAMDDAHHLSEVLRIAELTGDLPARAAAAGRETRFVRLSTPVSAFA